MIFIVFFIVYVSATSRFIQINKDVQNIPAVNPIAFFDPYFANARANNLLTSVESTMMTTNFNTWLSTIWGINVATGSYNPFTTGYDFSFGSSIPTTVIDPDDKII